VAELERIATYTSTLLVGLAEHLAASGVGVYKPDGYDPGDWAITLMAMPATPDHALALTPYLQPDQLDTPLTFTRVQLRHRAPKGQPTLALDDADAARDLLHRSGAVTLGTVRISRIQRVSLIPMGQDSAGRQEVACNYDLTGLRWLN
jgi:hypothetical protein